MMVEAKTATTIKTRANFQIIAFGPGRRFFDMPVGCKNRAAKHAHSLLFIVSHPQSH
jgi:hypothetical protein